MKTLHVAIAAVLPLAFACGPEEKTVSAAEPSPLPADAEPLPTPEEAAAQAESTIDETNADAELQKLKDELQGGG